LDYWVTVKYFSLFSLVLGFSAILIAVEEKLNTFKRKKKRSTMKSRIGGSILRILTLVVALAFTIGFEKLGVKANYQLREFYLNHSIVRTNGKIDGLKRIDLVEAGEEDFYLVSFKIGEKIVQKGLIIDYAKKDGYEIEDEINRIKKSLFVPRINGRAVEIVYSQEFPSFLKIKTQYNNTYSK
jgi:hypothetical protein|tara:strand:- start:530 stop:1078 length:549 start_codon:yes stop_codon:yes gene_type:complete